MPSKEKSQSNLEAMKYIAGRMVQGEVFTRDRIKEVYKDFGLSPHSVANLTNLVFRSYRFYEATGVKPRYIKERGRVFWYDGARDFYSETDIVEVRKQLREVSPK